ncbi:conserved hypothetical protein [Hyella patelloides LEGE 07179]|uniref:Glutamine synthetase inactivating factor IF7 n=1 Tax=Hyella patelloides LEGE 07179 TaxID=945734 RepID=A0A563VLH3_9CYAN|nr:hypothetical protein [Hyella patelloides]VEP12300.1 conserved hypothetical protein [Hyella patelloides LEGE 07179]
MSVQTQARSLLMRHHKMVMNRERSMLARTAAEIGLDVDPKFHSHIQGKTINDFASIYDRSDVAMS